MRQELQQIINDIQKLINIIKEDEYFNRVANVRGLFILRVKYSQDEFKGIHLIVSEEGRKEFGKKLKLLINGFCTTINITTSIPSGKGWNKLRNRKAHFQDWREIQIKCQENITDNEILLTFEDSKIIFSMNNNSLKTIYSILENTNFTTNIVPIKLLCIGQLNKKSQNLWLWHQGYNTSINKITYK